MDATKKYAFGLRPFYPLKLINNWHNKPLLKLTIVPSDQFLPLLKSFSKSEAYGTWLFWAMFLYS